MDKAKETNMLCGYSSNRDIEFQNRSRAGKGSWIVNMDMFLYF